MQKMSERVRENMLLHCSGFQQQLVAIASLESSSGIWFPGVQRARTYTPGRAPRARKAAARDLTKNRYFRSSYFRAPWV